MSVDWLTELQELAAELEAEYVLAKPGLTLVGLREGLHKMETEWLPTIGQSSRPSALEIKARCQLLLDEVRTAFPAAPPPTLTLIQGGRGPIGPRDDVA